MTQFLNEQNFNFINSLTKQIIYNENGNEIIKEKIKEEIEKIKNNESLLKINYLTILLLGRTGTGKSALVNNLLYNGKEVAAENHYDFGTLSMIEPKTNKKVPYLKLIDARRFELFYNEWAPETILINYSKFIEDQLKQNNYNDFVHCILYCISGN